MSSLMVEIRKGVVDLDLPRASVSNPDNDRDLGAGATGVLSTIGPFMVDRFAQALVATACECRPADMEPVKVDPRFVLAQPWRHNRMLGAIAFREQGGQPDAIQVDRVRFPGLPDLFTIIDGCHRTYAARAAGVDLIEATVHADLGCDPDRVRIDGRTLKHETESGWVPVSPVVPWKGERLVEKAALPIDIVMILQALGCRGMADTAPREFRFESL